MTEQAFLLGADVRYEFLTSTDALEISDLLKARRVSSELLPWPAVQVKRESQWKGRKLRKSDWFTGSILMDFMALRQNAFEVLGERLSREGTFLPLTDSSTGETFWLHDPDEIECVRSSGYRPYDPAHPDLPAFKYDLDHSKLIGRWTFRSSGSMATVFFTKDFCDAVKAAQFRGVELLPIEPNMS